MLIVFGRLCVLTRNALCMSWEADPRRDSRLIRYKLQDSGFRKAEKSTAKPLRYNEIVTKVGDFEDQGLGLFLKWRVGIVGAQGLLPAEDMFETCS